jgi:hypothetical protein
MLESQSFSYIFNFGNWHTEHIPCQATHTHGQWESPLVAAPATHCLAPPCSADGGGAALLHPRVAPLLDHHVCGIKHLSLQGMGLGHHKDAGVGQLRGVARGGGKGCKGGWWIGVAREDGVAREEGLQGGRG